MKMITFWRITYCALTLIAALDLGKTIMAGKSFWIESIVALTAAVVTSTTFTHPHVWDGRAYRRDK